MAMAKAAASGNIIMGRATYQMFAPMIAQTMPNLDVVVLSGSMQEGKVKCVKTPDEALEYLAAKGYKTATIAGGTRCFNAFLTEDLVDDVYMNLLPIAVHDGGRLQPEKEVINHYQLKESNTKDGVVMLHYAK